MPHQTITTHHYRGSALPVILFLTGILSLFAISALRSATTEARLSNSMLAAGNAFELAELGIAAGLRQAAAHPELLPSEQPAQLETRQPFSLGRLDTALHAIASDNQCSELGSLPAERLHFEIHATATLSTHLDRTHVQGFYICRELCAEACLAVEIPPVKTYWTVREN